MIILMSVSTIDVDDVSAQDFSRKGGNIPLTFSWYWRILHTSLTLERDYGAFDIENY